MIAKNSSQNHQQFYFQLCCRTTSALTEQATGTDNLLQQGPSNLSHLDMTTSWSTFRSTEPDPSPTSQLPPFLFHLYSSQCRSSCTPQLLNHSLCLSSDKSQKSISLLPFSSQSSEPPASPGAAFLSYSSPSLPLHCARAP